MSGVRESSPESPDEDWRVNNFDLIRLFAALQVASVHIIANLRPAGLGVAVVDAGLRLFPGVPIFFLVSGLLISRSFERSGSVRDYFRNRCLRIFPALWVCLVASIALVVIRIGAPGEVAPVSRQEWLLWWLAQMSLFQQYAPQFLHGLRLNGSLWTIPVELEFYLLVPVLYALLGGRRANWPLFALLALSVAVHWVFVHATPGSRAADYRVVLDTVLPYLWMFLTGVLIQRYWPILRGWFVGRAHWWILGYVLGTTLCREIFHITVGSADINIAFLVPLAGVVMSCAQSARELSSRILAHNDISYGTYIYHMPVVAVMLAFGVRTGVPAAILAVAVAASLGAISWFTVEKPFLRKKHGALRMLPAGTGTAVQVLDGGIRGGAG